MYIFIGGCSRTGTTLLARLLAEYSNVAAVPESQFKHHWFKSNEYANCVATEDDISNLQKSWRYQHWNVSSPNFTGKPRHQLYDDLCRRYIDHNLGTSASIVVDHTPANAILWPILAQIYPTSRFVHIYRDGRAVMTSLQRCSWGPSTALMASKFWTEHTCWGLAAEQVANDRTVRIRYEDLLQNPERMLNRLQAELEIELGSNRASGVAMHLPSYTREQHALVNKPVNAERANAWRNRISYTDLRYFEQHAGGLLHLLGYDMMLENPNTPQSGVCWMALREFVGACRKSVRRIRQSRIGATRTYS